jgi:hypothetical protein
MKPVSKSRQGARVHKVYDQARTPYQRLLESGVLTEAKKAELAAIYRGLNPVLLLKQLNGHLEQLWKLTQLPDPRPCKGVRAKGKSNSVTDYSEATMALR